MSSEPGLERYQVVETLGVNGLVTTYRVLDEESQMPAVLKVCLAEDPGVHDRFVTEVERIRGIEHPRLARILAAGVAQGHAYLAEELVEGEDFASVMASEPPSGIAERLRPLLDLAEALGYVHERGAHHGDLRPSKIRRHGDDLKLLDLGIARLARAMTPLTQERSGPTVAGYLAPEIVLGRTADYRVDIFALSVLLYQSLTRRPPFPGHGVGDILNRVLREDPPPISAAWPDCPPMLDRIVARGLAKDPARRYASCSELAAELTEALASHEKVGTPAPIDAVEPALPPPTPPERTTLPTRERRRLLSGFSRATLGAVVVLLILAASWLLAARSWRSRSKPAVVVAPVTALVATVAPPLGRLVVEARPWGLVGSITGDAVDAPILDAGASPATLLLPAGTYEVEVRNPEALDPLRCTVEITPATIQVCTVSFAEITGIDYFKEAGWWR